jgi:hypothetical protein
MTDEMKRRTGIRRPLVEVGPGKEDEGEEEGRIPSSWSGQS